MLSDRDSSDSSDSCVDPGSLSFEQRGLAFGDELRHAAKVQVTSANPPEAPDAFDRLVDSGYSAEQAFEHIAAVLACEIFAMAKERRVFDRARYGALLDDLPKLPFDQ